MMNQRMKKTNMSRTIKALSVRQPWASAIMAGLKMAENRSWTVNYRGPLLIHAAMRPAAPETISPEASELLAPLGDFAALPHGVALGWVELTDIVTPERWRSLWGASPLVTGPWCWRLERPTLLARQVDCPGRQKLFSVPADLLRLGSF